MYWRRFALSSIPIDDPVAFEVWLRARWMEKDALIEAYYQHGRFPADRGAHKTRAGVIVRGAGHIETEIKSKYWYEFLQVFAPVGLIALVLYSFYNSLPKTYTEPLNSQNVIKTAGELQRTQINLQNQRLLTEPAKNVSTDQDSMLSKAMTMYADVSKNSSVRKVVQLPELSSKGLKQEISKHQPAIDTILTQKNALRDLTPKRPARQVLAPPHGTLRGGTQTKASQKGSGQQKTRNSSQTPVGTLKASQRPPSKQPHTIKQLQAKAALPKRATLSTPQKLLNDNTQGSTMAASKLQSKPLPAKQKLVSTTNSTAK